MKKSNIITLIVFIVLIVATAVFSVAWKSAHAEKENTTSQAAASQTSVKPSSSEHSSENSSEESTESSSTSKTTSSTSSTAQTTKKKTEYYNTATISMNDALFIGDSRTVGLMEYADIKGADFFCTVGMSLYNIHKKPVSVKNVGKVSLTELLNKKKYGKIYVMLGINDVGYPFDKTVAKYKELLDLISQKQPEALIFIQANLHVSKSRSDRDKVVNNEIINKFNTATSKFADGKSKFYIDANTVFDDANGALAPDKSADDTHLYAKYYKEWGRWIIGQTAELAGEE